MSRKLVTADLNRCHYAGAKKKARKQPFGNFLASSEVQLYQKKVVPTATAWSWIS
jgi:hypothetical protein